MKHRMKPQREISVHEVGPSYEAVSNSSGRQQPGPEALPQVFKLGREKMEEKRETPHYIRQHASSSHSNVVRLTSEVTRGQSGG